jgi:hypothetical protein
MKVHHYHRGEFTVVEVDSPDTEEWTDFIVRLGFSRSPETTLGNSGSLSIDIHSQLNNGDGVLFEVGVTGAIECFIVKDTIDAMDLISRWGPACSLSQIEFIQGYIEESITRAFQAWHGHHPNFAVCHQCDPHEYERRQESRAKRNALKQKDG